ncbi:hypothetical protein [Desulfosporosinus nitroreducens]|uniref:Uncharacterized protein n=1 Tax=Desulfosporosinus nitroreducens TaxID=2018668 RepID=A0ABT8QX64_9FIRM|nr:hypothetical protein [Desulfosporosinus nitroreducens]MCO1601076.1 hypothetical protein [Desulfosporosinus nitroreducens]MDO0824461.1 hypothetical protein [Desulfosporosinus nitroreducens]
MNCPLCEARDVGRIGRERYYCRECCHEWTKGDGVVKIYEVLSDGSVERLETKSEPFPRALQDHPVVRRRAG